MSDPKSEQKMAAAEAKAAKAKAKALRPWFKKKRIIIPAVILLLIIAKAATGGSPANTGSDTNSSSSSGSQEQAMAKIGDDATDGSLKFNVSDVNCGRERIGNDVIGTKAQGQFCLITLSIENIGTEAQTLYADSQKLFDAKGREFSPDTTAALYLGSDASTIFEEINPGNTLNGVLIYDVPKNVSLDKIKLYESMFSGGVEVSLK